jgi:SAM-dependent methyltransferase
VLAAALLCTSLGCAGVSRLDFSHLGRGTWQRPGDVIAALEIEANSVVADLGAGEGYFEPYLADAVGPDGRVYAIEVEPERVDALSVLFNPGTGPVVSHLADLDDPGLPDGQIDLVLIVNTYHHIEDRPRYFARLRRDLNASGRVAIIEPNAQLGGVLGLFVEKGHASSAREILQEMRAAGYRRTRQFDLLPVQIFHVFEPFSENAWIR